jgi:TRAP-type C4-dicarboxylate transport system permease small subunit
METAMNELYKLTGPALARLVTYFLPIGLVALFGWLATMGFGTWDPVSQHWTFTLSVAEITAAAVVILGGSGLSITALLKGWKSRKGDQPVGTP